MCEAASLPGETTLPSLLSFEALCLCPPIVGVAVDRSSQWNRAIQPSSCPRQRRRRWRLFWGSVGMVSHE
jgi:hypothetical protein